MERDAIQWINSIDSELQKTSNLVNDLVEKFAELQAEDSKNADDSETRTTIFNKVQEMEQGIKDLSQVLGVQKGGDQVFSILSENEKSISELRKRMEQIENSLDVSNKLNSSSNNSDALAALVERVEVLNKLVNSRLLKRDGKRDEPKPNIKVSIESLKMVINDVKEELDNLGDTIKNIQETLATVVQEKVSRHCLTEALQMIEAKSGSDSADGRNELKAALNTLRLDVADVCQRVTGIEQFIKSKFSQMVGQLKEKAEKIEVTAAQGRMTSELQKMAIRLKLSASKALLENGTSRDEAAGIRKKVILHCISCDRPLLMEEKGRSNFRRNYIDPPYIRNKDGIYDVYRMRRGVGGVHTTMKVNEITPSTLKSVSKIASSLQHMAKFEQNAPVLQPEVNQNIEIIDSSEISHDLDIAPPDEARTIAPLSSPKQSDDETDQLEP
ncbi:glutamine rich 2 [Echinococcus multilocularis]|uniref:Glutamine rich 2 n=1 Tax=Echinococcus multilocularis TaxID=6211 RepID=A0A068YEV1_ECHMU|nr:glutamine rich 2 [Echinococcus multilocularis]